MLRGLIVLLIVANGIAFALLSGLLGPAPAAGMREPARLAAQIAPERMDVTALGARPREDAAAVGGPDPATPIHAAPLPQ